MLDLRGKTVWITGASSGLGEALAHAFASRGARLLLSSRRVDQLERVAHTLSALSPEVNVLPLDLAQLDTLPGKVDQALAQLGGRVDVMVHNAGIGQRSTVSETSFEVDRKLMEVNYLGPVALTKALLPSMIAGGGGRFVVISSVLGLISVKRRASYCASKHALHGYFNALRAELTEQQIGVLLVCPGHIATAFSREALEGDGKAHGVDDPGTKRGMSSFECADRTLRALIRGDQEIHPARWESLGVVLNRVAPGLMRRAAASLPAR